MRVYPARHPDALDAKYPILIDDMLGLTRAGKGRAIATIISMVRDLREHGRASRFLVRLAGFPIYELKPRSRGGEVGGARVYLFLTEHDEAGLVTCEVKDANAPDPEKLK